MLKTLLYNRHYDIVSLNLDLALDFPKRRIGGTATYTVQQLSEGDLILDQVALNIQEVTIDGDGASWRTPGIPWWSRCPSVWFAVGRPWWRSPMTHSRERDSHFRDTGRGSPDDYPEVWTQGQKNDNRYWFPAWDHPNDRFEYTGKVPVRPAGRCTPTPG